ncbi:LuxR C-terminal-related transcriptional regulator [Enterobacteriaceae bacterium H20N1]|uniref:LuxR C-terminal-related transcriptional regulator n=1 Tax=Dryocola boscaweniae TaxID=2925397 RepID=A0A9X3A9J6_9ENTR|nr:LuxR C-terminal-related transcriptional regulator [Dryocola boscaweniae]MCT4700504.1 LuxR C-terminal-related transcriptional regulator [Dryocola boscaweniae]MCT4717660.1 LuxR C-terminal-related transcriptional regulator [Dryocola boscaweniae]
MVAYRLTKSNFCNESPVSRIFVIDKTTIVAFAINKLLTNHPYLNVVGQCTDGHNALILCKKSSPNLIIIDPDLSGIDGYELIKQLLRYNPQLKFIIFFHENSQFRLNEYITLGIHGLVLKHSPPNTLFLAIQAVSRGTTFMDAVLAPASRKMSHDALKMDFMANPLSTPKLSARERQILTLITQGLKNKEIANKLVISPKTVESHRLNMMKKLDAHNIVDLIKWANRLNLA